MSSFRLPCSAFCFLSLATVGLLTGPAAVAESRPNIIYLMTDDQRMDTLGCYGNDIIQSPHLDRLAAEGVRFKNAFVPTSICACNRACVFSGQYMSRHGIHDFKTEFTPEALAQTYPGQLKSAGYRTGFIGKWGVGQPPQDLFDYNKGWPGQNRYYGRGGKNGDQHLTSLMGDQAIEFLDGCSEETPFCLSVSFKATHVQDSTSANAEMWPHDRRFDDLYKDVTVPPPKLADPKYHDALPDFLKNSENRMRWAVRFWGPERYQSSLKGYYRLVTGVDDVVGRLVEGLKQRGFDDNTVIIYTSDHGYYFGEYGFAGKWYIHDVSIRVPLIVYDPRLPESQRGATPEALALSIDMAPTILDVAGVTPPERMQGRSLVPIINGQTPEDWRKEFFYEHDFQPDWEGAITTIPPSQGVRTQRWAYARYTESDPLYEQLYDTRTDPIQEFNLATSEDHRDVLERMRRKTDKWAERVK